MNSDQSPATHSVICNTHNFWSNMDNDKKKEFLYIDSLYNRYFLENARSLVIGGSLGGLFSLFFYKIKNRFVLATLAAGFTGAVISQIKTSPVHEQYFKIWSALKNDKLALENLQKSTENIPNDYLGYYYHRYLKFNYPELNVNSCKSECKPCKE